MTIDREALSERRRQLQQKIKRDEQRARIASLLAELDAAHTPYSLIYSESAERPGHWVGDRFPFVGFSLMTVDWSRVPDSACDEWMGDDERIQLFRQVLLQHAASPQSEVILFRGYGGEPDVRLSAADAGRHAAILLRAFETWVVDASGAWLIECIWEAGRGGQLNHGRSPHPIPAGSPAD